MLLLLCCLRFFKSKKRDFTFFLLYFTRTIDSDEQHDTKLPLGEHAKAHPPVELCGLCWCEVGLLAAYNMYHIFTFDIHNIHSSCFTFINLLTTDQLMCLPSTYDGVYTIHDDCVCHKQQESPADARAERSAAIWQNEQMALFRAIRSANPKNTSLQRNMLWIGCTVCDIFTVKLYCDLETGVWSHSRSSKVAPLYRPTPKTLSLNQTSHRSVNQYRSYGHYCISKTAVSHHLGFYRTANSAIRSADLKNPSLEPNMECTVCEIFTFKLYCDLETGVRGHSRSSKVAPFDRAHTTLYSSSVVTMPLSITVSKIYPHIGRKLLPPSLYLAAPLGVKPSDLSNDSWWRKTRMMGLSESERISMMRSAVLTQSMRVTDRRTDGIGVAYKIICVIVYMLSRVKNGPLFTTTSEILDTFE